MKNATWPCRHKDPYPAMQTHRPKSPQTNYPPTSQCQDFLYNSERKTEILLFYFRLTFAAFRSAVELCFEYRNYVILSVILVLVVFVLYKSYWSPVLYVKELSDLGFEYIPAGLDRNTRITRAQNARRLGSKLPPAYPNGWFAVVESSELKVGEVKPVEVLGLNLCAYRGESGAPRVVDAYCPHLGAHLGGGSVSGDCVQCPFHKWSFDETGRCNRVPGQETAPRGVSIKTWETAEVDGAIWIWHDADGNPPKWTIDNAPELQQWGYRGRNEFVVSSHIQDIPENGADVAHLNAVHSPSLLTNLGERYPFLLNFVGQHTWSAQWTKGEDHTATMTLSHNYTFGKFSVFRIDALATQIGPAHVRLLIRTAFGPILISQSVTPLSPLEQKVIHRFFSPAYNAPLTAAFVRGESYMFERDVVIWNNKRFVSSPAYVKSDKTIRAFRSWYSQFYSEASLSFRDALRRHREPLDW